MTKAQHVPTWLSVGAVVVTLTYVVARAADETEAEAAKPSKTIKEVMHEAHMAPEGQKSLRDQVLEGQASPEQKKQLLDLYINLAENKPPRGEPLDWQKKTFLIVLSAAKVVVGREGAEAQLGKAVDCAACHKEHQPPQQ
jgi:hypothetical protein